jgi:hypothetical protein
MAQIRAGTHLRILALEIFKIEQASDIVKTKEGLLAWNVPSIARLCYLVRLNRPLLSGELEDLKKLVPEYSLENMKVMFASFNGLNFLNSVFKVYGFVPKLLDRGDFFTIQNIPFDILALNSYGRPTFTPQDVFLFAAIGDGLEDFIDGFDARGNIVTGRFSYSSEILFRWSDHETWFHSRCELATKMFRVRHNGVPIPFEIVH